MSLPTVPALHNPDGVHDRLALDREPETDYELVVGILVLCGVQFWLYPHPEGACAIVGSGRSPQWLMHFQLDGTFASLYENTRRPSIFPVTYKDGVRQ